MIPQSLRIRSSAKSARIIRLKEEIQMQGGRGRKGFSLLAFSVESKTTAATDDDMRNQRVDVLC